MIGLGVGGFEVAQPASDKFIVTTTRSHCDGVVQQALDILKPDEIIRVGGAGHKVCMQGFKFFTVLNVHSFSTLSSLPVVCSASLHIWNY